MDRRNNNLVTSKLRKESFISNIKLRFAKMAINLKSRDQDLLSFPPRSTVFYEKSLVIFCKLFIKFCFDKKSKNSIHYYASIQKFAFPSIFSIKF